jgi:AcrR family transcriptional regulator
MPRNIDTNDRVNHLSAAITQLMIDGGIPAVTMRAVASAVRLSTGTINNHLGGRPRLLGLAAGCFYRQMSGDVAGRSWPDRLLALLPADDDDKDWVRAWLAWSELARDEEVAGYRSADSDDFERGYIARSYPHLEPGDPTPDLLLAVVHGLRHAIARTDTSMPVERARELLSEAERRLTSPDGGTVTPPASPAGTPAPGPHPPAAGAR